MKSLLRKIFFRIVTPHYIEEKLNNLNKETDPCAREQYHSLNREYSALISTTDVKAALLANQVDTGLGVLIGMGLILAGKGFYRRRIEVKNKED